MPSSDLRTNEEVRRHRVKVHKRTALSVPLSFARTKPSISTGTKSLARSLAINMHMPAWCVDQSTANLVEPSRICFRRWG